MFFKFIKSKEKAPSKNELKDVYVRLSKSYKDVQNFRTAIDTSDISAINQCLEACKIFQELYATVENNDRFFDMILNNGQTSYLRIHLPDFNTDIHFSTKENALDKVKKELVKTVEFRETLLKDAKSKIEIISSELALLKFVQVNSSEKPVDKGSVADADNLPFSNITKKTSREKLGNFVAIDIETTGLYPAKNEIVEIAAVRFKSFKPMEAFTTLCSVKKGLNESAKQINGITEEMLVGKPLFGCVAQSLLDFIGDDNIVAHNLDFDLRFIVKHGVKVFEKNRKYFCTLEIAQRTLKAPKEKWDNEVNGWITNFNIPFDVENYKLTTLCQYYKIPLIGAHRALSDCIAAGYLLEALAKDRE